jgi:hypothetical protein
MEDGMNLKKFAGGLGCVAAVVLLICGCATSGYQKAGRSALSMSETKAEIQGAYSQVASAAKALDRLMGASVGDLRPLFQGFVAEVKKLEGAASAARSRAIAMQARSQDYFNTWSQEIESINDPAIKGQSLKRLGAAKTSYQQVERSLFETRDGYVPLIASLGDIQTALGQDLTPAGLAAIRPAHLKARQQTIALQGLMKNSMSAIDAATKELRPRAASAAR